MKRVHNDHIHVGLPQSEIRNFLSKQLKDAQLRIINYVEGNEPQNHPFDTIIYRAKEDIKKLENRIVCHETIKGIVELMKIMGWEEFDVSNETISYNREWMSFIGTKKEYDNLLLHINGD